MDQVLVILPEQRRPVSRFFAKFSVATYKKRTMKQLRFSIIIPSYNEGGDVRIAIESAIGQTYPDKEVFVVDDSSDNTPEIIKEYEGRGVTYVRGRKRGCCGAKNFGIELATGDVVVILNSDTAPSPDFLERIKVHYENGADYVVVRSRVINDDRLFARYVEMLDRYLSTQPGNTMYWSEGFSCRRAAALEVGGFPGDFSVRFCRDWVLGANLSKAGFKKVVDRSIEVWQKSPETLKEYSYFREIRGRFSVLSQYYLFQKPLWFLMAKFAIKESIAFLQVITLIFPLYRAARIAAKSETSLKDFPGFFLATIIDLLGRTFGEWRGFAVIFRYGKEMAQKEAESEYKRRW